MKVKNSSLGKLVRAAAVAAAITAMQPAQASEFGCKILLCLAAPASIGGPWSIPECVPDLRRLFDMLWDGDPFPTCDFVDGGDGRTHANMVYDYFDPCPEGTMAVQPGTMVVEGKSNPSNYWNGGFDIIGTPIRSEVQDDRGPPSARACTGPVLGSYDTNHGDGDTIYVYDRVVWMQPQNPSGIDVYVNNKWWQRVRY